VRVLNEFGGNGLRVSGLNGVTKLSCALVRFVTSGVELPRCVARGLTDAEFDF
jgi:hypothetical protein